MYGGGGITPDVHYAPPKATRFQKVVLDMGMFQGFTEQYLAHRTLTKDFAVDDAVLKEFKKYLDKQGIQYSPQEFKANEDWVKTNIKSSLFTTEFGESAGLKVQAESDPEIGKAEALMPEADKLEQHVVQVLAEKQAALEKGPGAQ